MRLPPRRTLILSSVLAATAAQADLLVRNSAPLSDQLTPRLTLGALVGNHKSATGKADVLVPLLIARDALWHGDLQGKYGRGNTWSLGLGAGYRRILDTAQIGGGYVFLDYSAKNHHKGFWLLNPGAELIGTNWQVNANAYLPVDKQQQIASTNWGSHYDLGENFTGHNVYDRKYDELDGTAIGADLQGSWTFNRQVTPSLGAYYLRYPKDKKIDNQNRLGIAAGIAYTFNPYITVELRDTYDKTRKNTLMGGVKLSLGGEMPGSTNLVDHLRDPIERHIASLGMGSALPIETTYHGKGNLDEISTDKQNFDLLHDNTHFYEEGAKGKACTYEEPCGNFNQDAVDEATKRKGKQNEDVQYYVGSGTYTMNQVTLEANQTLAGRTKDFRFAAEGEDQPWLIGSLTLGNGNTVKDVRLKNNENGTETTGITFKGQDSTVDHVQIGTREAGYATGVEVVDGTIGDIINNKLTHSTVYANSKKTAGEQVRALKVDATKKANQTTLTVSDSQFSAKSEKEDAYGIEQIKGVIQLTNNTFSKIESTDKNAIGIKTGGGKLSSGGNNHFKHIFSEKGDVTGISAAEQDHTNNPIAVGLNQNDIFTGHANGTGKSSRGIDMHSGHITTEGTQLDFTSEAGNAIGAKVAGGKLDVKNGSIFKAHSEKASAEGLKIQQTGEVSTTGGQFTASTQQGTVKGVHIAGGTLNLKGDNHFSATTQQGEAYGIHQTKGIITSQEGKKEVLNAVSKSGGDVYGVHTSSGAVPNDTTLGLTESVTINAVGAQNVIGLKSAGVTANLTLNVKNTFKLTNTAETGGTIVGIDQGNTANDAGIQGAKFIMSGQENVTITTKKGTGDADPKTGDNVTIPISEEGKPALKDKNDNKFSRIKYEPPKDKEDKS